jgi:hypothetical protein
MSKHNDGGPAFPVPENVAWDEHHNTAVAGMSLRDWFAGQAMKSLILDAWYQDQPSEPMGKCSPPIARDAYTMADAMLRAREETNDE